MSDETSILKPEAEAVAQSNANNEEDEVIQSSADEKKTPKRTPKRRSFIERAQRESEELVRTMGGSLELEGGRRTRSSTRGTPTRAAEAVTPPPTKKARTSPATTKSGGRARGARKLDVGGDDEVEQEPAKSKPVKEEEKEAQVTEPVKAKITAKKDKKDEKAEKHKEVDNKGKKDVKSQTSETKATESKETKATEAKVSKATEAKVTKATEAKVTKATESKVTKATEPKVSKTTESKDQPDSAKESAALKDEEQNNVDHDKESTKEPEVKEKASEELIKPEEPAKVEEPPKSDVIAAPAAAESMEVDDEEKQESSTEQPEADKTTSNKSAPAVVTETVGETKVTKESQEKSPEQPKVEDEPAKPETPEPMEVDSSSKSSTETVNAISPVKEVAAEIADPDKAESTQKAPSNKDVVELPTEVKEDAPPKPEKEANAGDVESTSAEKKTTVVDEAPAPVSNDVEKLTPVDTADTVVTEPPAAAVKEPQAKCENKAEHNDNGEPKIVNNAAEDGENHVTPQACN